MRLFYSTILLTGFAFSAQADFSVCNQSFDVVNIAIGQDNGAEFATEGWWTVGTNQCATVIKGDLTNRYVYVHATDVFGQPILDGVTTMCIGSKRFTITGIDDCWRRGYKAAGFFEVDTKAVERWTLFLSPLDFN
ncbi:DUF1036 domain-containing protein [Actibacterium sp. 188UL27-1]|uniref:DUF1036 domain-containing protein n=1 Tax=Actibacterium sp. 188UL27-1 TaxID=2786961 RepID=UPI00195674C8|nr:DUF1036 domain-containing protein [Actibacterium sp. 188UL27-1]MBM7068848.1 DUF1036 domain-containing protein [Actibacterium sp. 188UL27-1]